MLRQSLETFEIAPPTHEHPRHSPLHSPTRVTSQTTAQIASAGASMTVSAEHVLFMSQFLPDIPRPPRYLTGHRRSVAFRQRYGREQDRVSPGTAITPRG